MREFYVGVPIEEGVVIVDDVPIGITEDDACDLNQNLSITTLTTTGEEVAVFPEWGWITLTERVTNGHMTWFETQRYLYYSPEEARSLFLEHVKDNNWTIKEEA